ncbi:MAG: hypothetical protein ACQEQ4_09745 [Fibrobacterota bacterium]
MKSGNRKSGAITIQHRCPAHSRKIQNDKRADLGSDQNRIPRVPFFTEVRDITGATLIVRIRT